MSQDSPTKIAVFPQDKFKKLGYFPVIHPDGYIIMERQPTGDETSDSNLSSVEVTEISPHKADPTPRGKLEKSVQRELSGHFPPSKSADINKSTLPPLKVDNSFINDKGAMMGEKVKEVDEENDDSTSFLYSEDIHADEEFDSVDGSILRPTREQVLGWQRNISEDGHCYCIFPSCNFISPTVCAMEKHLLRCKGEPLFHSNVCTRCGCWLNSTLARDTHSVNCRGKKFGATTARRLPSVSSSTSGPSKLKSREKTEFSNYREVRQSSSKDKTNSSGDDEDIDPIIQPLPELPPLTYRRRRACIQSHKESWAKKLAECRYLRCHFQGCMYIAMSVEDMCNHYGFCNGDSTFANYHCVHCGGVVTSQQILDIHIKRSHGKNQVNYLPPSLDKNHASSQKHFRIKQIDTSPVEESKLYSAIQEEQVILEKIEIKEQVQERFRPSILKKSLVKKIEGKEKKLDVSTASCQRLTWSNDINQDHAVAKMEEYPQQTLETLDDKEIIILKQVTVTSDEVLKQSHQEIVNKNQVDHDVMDVSGDHLHYTRKLPNIYNACESLLEDIYETAPTFTVVKGEKDRANLVQCSETLRDFPTSVEMNTARLETSLEVKNKNSTLIKKSTQVEENHSDLSQDFCETADPIPIEKIIENRISVIVSAEAATHSSCGTKEVTVKTANYLINAAFQNDSFKEEAECTPSSLQCDKLKSPLARSLERRRISSDASHLIMQGKRVRKLPKKLESSDSEDENKNKSTIKENCDGKMPQKLGKKSKKVESTCDSYIQPNTSDKNIIEPVELPLTVRIGSGRTHQVVVDEKVEMKPELDEKKVVNTKETQKKRDSQRKLVEHEDQFGDDSKNLEVQAGPGRPSRFHSDETLEVNEELKESKDLKTAEKPKKRGSNRKSVEHEAQLGGGDEKDLEILKTSNVTQADPGRLSRVQETLEVKEEINKSKDANAVEKPRKRGRSRGSLVEHEAPLGGVGENDLIILKTSITNQERARKVLFDETFEGKETVNESKDVNNVEMSKKRRKKKSVEPETQLGNEDKKDLEILDTSIAIQAELERPLKVLFEETVEGKEKVNESKDVNTVEKPRKRGRKRKSVEYEAQLSDDREKDLKILKTSNAIQADPERPRNILFDETLEGKEIVNESKDVNTVEMSKKRRRKSVEPETQLQLGSDDGKDLKIHDTSNTIQTGPEGPHKVLLDATLDVKEKPNESKDLNTEKIPKKRGRKRKAIDNVADTQVICDGEKDAEFIETPIRDRPGRPRKALVDQTSKLKEALDESKNSAQLPKRRGRKPKIVEPVADDRLSFDDESDDETPIVVRAGPGRPRKVLEDEASKLKEELDESKNSAQLPKRRGRKPKIVEPVAEDRLSFDDESDDETPIVVRAGPGRPRKVLVDEASKLKEELDESNNSAQLPKRRGRKPKIVEPVADDRLSFDDESDDESDDETPIVVRAGPGRPRKVPLKEIKGSDKGREARKSSSKRKRVTCGKCQKELTVRRWEQHNALEHAGLAWQEGEPPIDWNTADPTHLLALLREAFKICRTATCERCGDVKKSFLGFNSHIQVCGKSEKEIEDSLSACEICGKKLKPVSMSTHLRMVHPPKQEVVEEIIDEPVNDEKEEPPIPGKRRSALKAMKSLKNALADEKPGCIFYKKGDIVPELSAAMTPKYNAERMYKCRRKDCNDRAATVGEAINHFFICPTMPAEYYQCTECAYFTLQENDARSHKHKEKDSDFKIKDEPGNDECEESESSDDDVDEGVEEVALEIGEQEEEEDEADQEGCEVEESGGRRRRNDEILSSQEQKARKLFEILEVRFPKDHHFFYNKAFALEISAQSGKPIGPQYPELNTTLSDWVKVEESSHKKYLPPLEQSLPVKYEGQKNKQFETCQVFEPFQNKALAACFVGGPVQNLAWCPVSFSRAASARQLLAVTVSSHMDKPPKPSTKCNVRSSLIQIWDFGPLSYKEDISQEDPHMVVGLATDYGEIWDLAWCPNDVWHDGDDLYLPRLGLLAAAFDDGVVRIFSVNVLKSAITSNVRERMFKVEPVAMLKKDNQETNDPCLCLTWQGDILCAGYRSGVVSGWRLSQLVSSRVKKIGKTLVMPSMMLFQAHRLPVNSLALNSDTRLLATGCFDRVVKHWDLRNTSAPLRCEPAAHMQKLKWLNNWPGLLYFTEDDDLSIDMPPELRNKCTIHLKAPTVIKDVTFSDWLFLTAVSTTTGEILLRPTPDPISGYSSSKKKKMVVASKSKLVQLDEKGDGTLAKNATSYSDLLESQFGIIFTDNNVSNHLSKMVCNMEAEYCIATHNPRVAEKMSFNPNYMAFNKLAVGYKCGILRLISMNYLKEEITACIAKHLERTPVYE